MTTLPGLPHLLAAATPTASGFRSRIPDHWLQGRTAYGGLSAALALEAVLRRWPDLPPLRSAQIAFIGPLSGEVEVSTELLRRGRNAAFIQADLRSEAGLGLRATFVFMAAQDSHVDHPPKPLVVEAPEDLPSFQPPANVVAFAQNFAFRQRVMDQGVPDIRNWAQLRQRGGLHPMVELMAVGDVLPPAAMALFTRAGPISSLNWQVNLLTDRPATRDGWWLLRATADQAQQGSSSQRMGIWNSDGQPIAAMTQSVALFV